MRTCPDCGKNYTSRSSLWVHRRINHADTIQNVSARPAPYYRGVSGESNDLGNQYPKNEENVKSDSEETVSSEGKRYEEESDNILSDSSALEDEESDSESMDMFGRVDDETESVNLTSEVEDSYSESESNYDSDEEVDMPEAGRQESFIRWPIIKSYRISLPWSYWGSEPKIKKYRRWIKRIHEKENATIIYNVKRALDVEIATLCEIAYNCLHHQVPIEKNNLIHLRRYRRALLCLADPNASIEEKRECILLQGADFVNSIIDCIHPLIVDNVLGEIKVPQDNTTEGTEDEQEEENENVF